jgi:hypothetical protein
MCNRTLKRTSDSIYIHLLRPTFIFCTSALLRLLSSHPISAYGVLPTREIFICWASSFIVFEYVWGIRGWTMETRVLYFEERWAYFLGFGKIFGFIYLIGGGVFIELWVLGLPLSVLTLWAPSMIIRIGLVAILVPFVIPEKLPLFFFLYID